MYDRRKSRPRQILVSLFCVCGLGYFAYHAVPTNYAAPAAFRSHVVRLWLGALRRRSQKNGLLWERMQQLADQWLPQAEDSPPVA